MKNFFLIAPLLLAVTQAAWANIERANTDDEVIQQDRSFRVKYADGTQERYLVAYRGYVSQNAHESGGPAIPEKFKFVDDRQCHWTINSRIQRIVNLVHRSGRQIPYEKLSVRWQVPFTGKGSDFVLTQLRSENCNDAWPRFQSDVNDAKGRVRSEFPNVVAADTDTLKKLMSDELNGEVIVERGR